MVYSSISTLFSHLSPGTLLLLPSHNTSFILPNKFVISHSAFQLLPFTVTLTVILTELLTLVLALCPSSPRPAVFHYPDIRQQASKVNTPTMRSGSPRCTQISPVVSSASSQHDWGSLPARSLTWRGHSANTPSNRIRLEYIDSQWEALNYTAYLGSAVESFMKCNMKV